MPRVEGIINLSLLMMSISFYCDLMMLYTMSTLSLIEILSPLPGLYYFHISYPTFRALASLVPETWGLLLMPRWGIKYGI